MSAEARRWLVYAQENLRAVAARSIFLRNTLSAPSCRTSNPMPQWLGAASPSPTTWSLL